MGDFLSAQGGFAITPHDTNDIQPTRFLYVTGTGNLKVKFVDGTIVAFTGIPAATLLPFAVRRVYATDTSATGIIGLL